MRNVRKTRGGFGESGGHFGGPGPERHYFTLKNVILQWKALFYIQKRDFAFKSLYLSLKKFHNHLLNFSARLAAVQWSNAHYYWVFVPLQDMTNETPFPASD